MAFINIVAEEEATGAAETLYNQGRETFGYLPNMFKAFSHRPEVMGAFFGLLGNIRGEMDTRRYELVTIAAARALRSSYCMLAHGSVLLNEFYEVGELTDIANDYRNANLSAADVAIMEFAEKVVRDAVSITQSDVDGLRNHGLSDSEIFDITAAAAVRCFFSKTLDALGAEPDSSYNDLEDELRQSLTVGRPISGTAKS